MISFPKRLTAARYVFPLGPSFGPFARICWVPSISQQYAFLLAQYRTDGFFAMIRSEHEVTVVAAEAMLDDTAWAAEAVQVDRAWRRVTFPGPLPWELVGFLADVAGRLAAAQIPFTSMSGFTTDHVLVRAAQADLAVAVLSGQQPPPQRPGTNP